MVTPAAGAFPHGNGAAALRLTALWSNRQAALSNRRTARF